METFLTEHGLPALFGLSFLASTLVPIGSEWLLAVLLLEGRDPHAAVAVATLGNSLGALTTWAIGLWGGSFFMHRVLRVDESSRRRAEGLYARFGSWSLLLSWLPIVGDPLCLVGGLLRVGLLRFILLVGIGKLVRYAAVAGMVLEGGRLLG